MQNIHFTFDKKKSLNVILYIAKILLSGNSIQATTQMQVFPGAVLLGPMPK